MERISNLYTHNPFTQIEQPVELYNRVRIPMITQDGYIAVQTEIKPIYDDIENIEIVVIQRTPNNIKGFTINEYKLNPKLCIVGDDDIMEENDVIFYDDERLYGVVFIHPKWISVVEEYDTNYTKLTSGGINYLTIKCQSLTTTIETSLINKLDHSRIGDFKYETAPESKYWLICDGRLLVKDNYPELMSMYNYNEWYIVSDTTEIKKIYFRLPNQSDIWDSDTIATQSILKHKGCTMLKNKAVNDTVGNKYKPTTLNHTHSITLGSHDHTYTYYYHKTPERRFYGDDVIATIKTGSTSQSTDLGTKGMGFPVESIGNIGFDNLPARVTANLMIKVK